MMVNDILFKTPFKYLRAPSIVQKLIIKRIKDKNARNDYGVTPPHLAARNGHFEVCLLILEIQADCLLWDIVKIVITLLATKFRNLYYKTVGNIKQANLTTITVVSITILNKLLK